MPKRGLPTSVKMRHDSHYVDEIATASRTVGKILPIEKLEPNPDQPRVEFGDLTDLTSSIKEQGVLEPILVKPIKEKGIYMIIAGERRWQASTLAGLTEVPCIELDIDDKSVAEIAIVENLQRKDLTIWEIADGLADLAERYNYTHDDIAKKIGKSRSTVTESLAIAGLPTEIRQKCQNKGINSKSTLVEISRQFDADAMCDLIDQTESKGLNRKKIRKKTGSKSKASRMDLTSNNNSNEKESPKLREYRFKSENNDFDLIVKFDHENFNKRDVLKALKEAFDHVKSK